MVRLKAPPQAVPQTLAEAERLALEIGDLMRQIAAAESALAGAIALMKLDAKNGTAPLAASIKAKFSALTAFAQGHRDDILPPNRKSRSIAAGVIGWRVSTPAVEIEADMEDAVIAYLREHGGDAFLVETTTISKAAILADRDFAADLPHVSITQVEQFYFKPLDVDLEQTRNLGKSTVSKDAA